MNTSATIIALLGDHGTVRRRGREQASVFGENGAHRYFGNQFGGSIACVLGEHEPVLVAEGTFVEGEVEVLGTQQVGRLFGDDGAKGGQGVLRVPEAEEVAQRSMQGRYPFGKLDRHGIGSRGGEDEATLGCVVARRDERNSACKCCVAAGDDGGDVGGRVIIGRHGDGVHRMVGQDEAEGVVALVVSDVAPHAGDLDLGHDDALDVGHAFGQGEYDGFVGRRHGGRIGAVFGVAHEDTAFVGARDVGHDRLGSYIRHFGFEKQLFGGGVEFGVFHVGDHGFFASLLLLLVLSGFVSTLSTYLTYLT